MGCEVWTERKLFAASEVGRTVEESSGPTKEKVETTYSDPSSMLGLMWLLTLMAHTAFVGEVVQRARDGKVRV